MRFQSKPINRWAFLILFATVKAMASDIPPELEKTGCISDIKKVAATKTEDVYYCFNKNDVGLLVTLNTKSREVKVIPDLKDVPDWKQNIFLRSR
jgi:hypothetical protein